MGTPYLGEIRVLSFSFAPKGWAFCNGQLLPIQQNTALFSLLGTMYGGDGRSTFALPNLQGCSPIHFGLGIAQGTRGGEAVHTLTTNEMPAHTHPVNCTTSAANQNSPGGHLWAGPQKGTNPNHRFGLAPNCDLMAAAVTTTGQGQPHPNLQPFLVLNFVIALQGIYPSQN